jgi:hypothetical protein
MDTQAHDVERAQWDQARKARERQEAEAQRRIDERVAAAAPARPEARSHRGRWIGAVAAVTALVVIAGVVVVVHQRSSQAPTWVRQLGLDQPHPASGRAPDRLGAPGPASAPATVADTGTIDVTAAPRPDIDTTGEDFDRIWRQIEVLEDWLLLHPDPKAVSEIYVAGTDPSDQLVTLLTQLQQDGQTIDVKGYRIVGVTVESRPSSNVVVLRYADTYSDRVQLDHQGHVVSDSPYDGKARFWSLTLKRGSDSRWRVDATSFIGFGDQVPSA